MELLTTEQFENGALKTSTTPYRWMTDDEFLSEIERRLGRSPIIDELAMRMARNQDAIDFIHQAEEETKAVDAEHKRTIAQLESDKKELQDQLGSSPTQMRVHCKVCDADLTIKL